MTTTTREIVELSDSALDNVAGGDVRGHRSFGEPQKKGSKEELIEMVQSYDLKASGPHSKIVIGPYSRTRTEFSTNPAQGEDHV